jgi:hypothetical protein
MVIVRRIVWNGVCVLLVTAPRDSSVTGKSLSRLAGIPAPEATAMGEKFKRATTALITMAVLLTAIGVLAFGMRTEPLISPHPGAFRDSLRSSR